MALSRAEIRKQYADAANPTRAANTEPHIYTHNVKLMSLADLYNMSLNECSLPNTHCTAVCSTGIHTLPHSQKHTSRYQHLNVDNEILVQYNCLIEYLHTSTTGIYEIFNKKKARMELIGESLEISLYFMQSILQIHSHIYVCIRNMLQL